MTKFTPTLDPRRYELDPGEITAEHRYVRKLPPFGRHEAGARRPRVHKVWRIRTVDPDPKPAEQTVLPNTTDEAIQALEDGGLGSLANQLLQLLELDRQGELEDEPIDSRSVRYATALALQCGLRDGVASWVVDGQGQMGLEIEKPNGITGALVVQGNGHVVLVLDNERQNSEWEHRIKGKGRFDWAAETIDTYFASEPK